MIFKFLLVNIESYSDIKADLVTQSFTMNRRGEEFLKMPSLNVLMNESIVDKIDFLKKQNNNSKLSINGVSQQITEENKKPHLAKLKSNYCETLRNNKLDDCLENINENKGERESFHELTKNEKKELTSSKNNLMFSTSPKKVNNEMEKDIEGFIIFYS